MEEKQGYDAGGSEPRKSEPRKSGIEIERVVLLLGEREFEVAEASFLRARPWKKQLIDEIQPLFTELSEAQDMEFAGPADLLKLMPLAEKVLIEAMDKVFGLLIGYSPVLEAEREYIEGHATDKQILGAFQEVVRLADPFGMIAQFNRRIGRSGSGTLSSLGSPNGASPSKKRRRSPTA